MGYAVGQLYEYTPGTGWALGCECKGPEAKWNTTSSSNGQICKVRNGWNCRNVIGEGVRDGSDCVNCSGRIKIQKDKLLKYIKYTTKM